MQVESRGAGFDAEEPAAFLSRGPLAPPFRRENALSQRLLITFREVT